MISKEFRTIHKEDGKDYIFNTAAFREYYYAVTANKRGSKKEVKQLLAKYTKSSEETVSSWLKGTNGPQPEKLMEIANFFNADFHTFLEKKPKEENNMQPAETRIISKSERKTAKKLYRKLYDLIFNMQYSIPDCTYDNLTEKDTLSLKGKLAQYDSPYTVQAQYNRIISKEKFDLPSDLRSELSEFVDDVFYPFMDRNEMAGWYFDPDDYEEYCRKNSMDDSEMSRIETVKYFV